MARPPRLHTTTARCGRPRAADHLPHARHHDGRGRRPVRPPTPRRPPSPTIGSRRARCLGRRWDHMRSVHRHRRSDSVTNIGPFWRASRNQRFRFPPTQRWRCDQRRWGVSCFPSGGNRTGSDRSRRGGSHETLDCSSWRGALLVGIGIVVALPAQAAVARRPGRPAHLAQAPAASWELTSVAQSPGAAHSPSGTRPLRRPLRWPCARTGPHWP